MAKQFDIQKIHKHEEDWQDEWGRLLEALLLDENHKAQDEQEDLTHWGPLGRSCRMLLRMSDELPLLDDFISYVLDQYVKRVEKQTLFGQYDPEKGDPIAFLCSFTYLLAYLKKYHTEHLRYISLNEPVKLKDDDDDDVDNQPKDPQALTPEMVVVKRKLHMLFQSLNSSVIIHCPKVGSRLYEQAGLQLYPRLSTKNEEMVRLHDDTKQKIAKIHNTTETTADSKINKKHHDECAELERKINDLNLDLKTNLYRKDDSRELDRQKVLILSKKLIFAPLSNASLVELLQMPAENVARCLSRYLEKLPDLFDDYQKIYDQIAIQNGETEDE